MQRFKFVYVSLNGEIPKWSVATRDSIYNNVDTRLQGSEPFATVGNRVYTGPLELLKRLDHAYSVDVIGPVTEDHRDAIKAAIIDSWADANLGEKERKTKRDRQQTDRVSLLDCLKC